MRTLIDYTAHDVTPEDRTQYAAHVDLWQTELQPNGALECYFAAEIVRAAENAAKSVVLAGRKRVTLAELQEAIAERWAATPSR